jgi:beta propeller repeat protein
MSRLVRFVSVVFALVVLTVALAGAVAQPAHAALPFVQETPLSTGAGTQDAPCAFGDLGAIWEDDSLGTWGIGYAYDGDTTRLALGPSDQRHPATYAPWIVYEDDRDGTLDVYGCLPFGTPATPYPLPSETPIATGPGDQCDPATDGTTVAYEDNAAGNWDVWCLNLDTSVAKRLSASAADQLDPATSGSHVVYADHRNGNWDVYLYDRKTNKTKRLTTSKADQTAPQISGDVVVYQDHRNGNWDIYAYMIKAGVEKRLTASKADQTAPQVWAQGPHHIVVYQDARNGNADLYFYDLGFKREWRLTDDPADQTEPSASGTRVVWTDMRGGDQDIYQGTLVYPTLTVSGPSETPRYNSTVTFRGHLSVPDATVVKTGAGGRQSKKTDDAGKFSFSVAHVQRKITVHVVCPGSASCLPTKSKTLTVKPKALLTRPHLVERGPSNGWISLTADYEITGYLKPHHPAGSSAVLLRVYRKGPIGSYSLFTSLKVKVSDYSTYSRYDVTRSWAPTYSYKVVAVHADADHAKTVSAFSNAQ